jgi:transcriptional regulator with XRE-family HTH domain/DNA-directed RNA polymerase subunit RPC12/RpoP
MDQVKIGEFIQAKRKEKGFTQREVAERLNISDKTVSKWETGNGLPEVGCMLPLCEILEISVNELLSGEELDEKQYFKKAEENIMDLIKEKAEAKKKIILSAIVVVMGIIAVLTLVSLAGLLEMPVWLRITLIAVAVVILLMAIVVACILDREAGVYECRICHKRFVPTMRAYVWGAHTITTRRLKCPYCGKKSFCKKRLTSKEE